MLGLLAEEIVAALACSIGLQRVRIAQGQNHPLCPTHVSYRVLLRRHGKTLDNSRAIYNRSWRIVYAVRRLLFRISGEPRMKIPEAFRDSRFQIGFIWGLGCGLFLMFLAANVYVLGKNPSEPR
jgi:hypothetical protein